MVLEQNKERTFVMSKTIANKMRNVENMSPGVISQNIYRRIF